MPPDLAQLWQFLPWGYAITVALELPILLIGLSSRHSLARRTLAGFWLTACTYPIVVLVLPLTVWQAWGYRPYLAIAETFAPLAECLIFIATFDRSTVGQPRATGGEIARDAIVITAANLNSFLLGGWLWVKFGTTS